MEPAHTAEKRKKESTTDNFTTEILKGLDFPKDFHGDIFFLSNFVTFLSLFFLEPSSWYLLWIWAGNFNYESWNCQHFGSNKFTSASENSNFPSNFTCMLVLIHIWLFLSLLLGRLSINLFQFCMSYWN